jgi:hypothetical protein
MFKSKTLFVVGAGASAEVRLPVGAELKDRIATVLNIRFPDGFQQKTGSLRIADALRCHVRGQTDSRNDINPYLHVARSISGAMTQALSIDNYLDAHQDDGNLQLCGKLAIAETILTAEQNSDLRLRERAFNHSAIGDTWYVKFFQLLTENVRRANIDTIFDNVAFITFNYDRCIEHYLAYALQNYYRLTESEAHSLVSKLTILHPYGSVGPLPWQASNGIEFGAEVSGERLLQLSTQIKTFTQRVEDEKALSILRDVARGARTIIFLGFAFHRMNLELISPKQKGAAEQIFGTALNFSDPDRATVEKELRAIFKMHRSHPVRLHSALEARRLLAEYWRTLAA